MDANKSEVLQGTLDLMILKTLHVLGPLHGFGINRPLSPKSGSLYDPGLPSAGSPGPHFAGSRNHDESGAPSSLGHGFRRGAR